MLFINFLCLLYLMVHVDSHTISKSIDNDNKVDDIDSITDVERTRSPKLKRDRLQNNYRLDYKDEFVRPEYVFKETKLYSEAETTTQKTSPKSTTEHPKHHKSPKRRVGSFWRKLRGKDKKIKHENVSRKRRIPKNKEHVPKHTTTAVYRASKLKNKRKTKNPFTPRPPDGKHVKREVDNTIIESDPTTEPALTFEPALTAEPTPIAETASIAEPVSITESNSLHKNCKLGVGKTAQYDNIQKSKFKIKTVEPYKMTERVADASEGSENGPLEPLSTQLANLKNKYGLNKGVPNTFSLSPSKHRTESTTPKTTTVEEPEFAGTAQIEELLNDIKVKAIARITQENPMVTDVITNTVNEATFEADPILTHIATTGYDMDTIKDISSQNAERTVSLENENEIDQNDPTLKSNTESHYIVARSIKDDTITMAHNVEDKLEKELKSIYNKVKHKVSCDFNKAKSTIKQGINKISSTCGINITTTKISTKATHKPATKAKAHNTKPAEKTKEKATSRHIRGTPTLKTTVKSDQDFSKTTYDDYVMLTLYEEMLAKTHEENIRKMLSTTDVPLVRKRRHHLRLSKRNPETLGDVKLKEVVEKLYDDSANMPDYDMGDMEPSANANMTTTHPSELPNSDNGSLEPPVVIQEGVMSEPEQHIHNSASTLMPSSAEEDLTDTSLEGLSNKISYNDFVNGYRHYLKFQKEQGHQNFSNLVKYQAHRHHSVDDIGKFILNKIPHVPSVRRKRSFLDESDMDYQEITTKSDDSWFKKHFYLFIDNGPPKKFHTSQTVELKSAATEAPKTYGTDAMIPKPARKDQVYISIGSDEATKDKTTKDSAISLEDLSNALDSIKIKQTVGPYYKDLKTHSKLNTTPRNIANTEDSIQSFMGRIFGGKRSQAAQQSTWSSSDDWSPVEMFTENPMNRMKRTVNEGSVSIVDDFVNKELEEKPTTATKDFAESSVKTRGTNKYGYVDIDLVPRQTAVVKLRENTKKSRFKNFFKRFHFKKNEKKTKEKPKRSCYNDEENYGFGNRRSRFNPIKKLKDMFRVKPEGRKEEGPAVYNNPPNIPDYDMMTSHIDTFKPVKYDKPMSVDEMQRQIPNISDADALITKPTTAQTSYHFQLDDSDRALLSHYPTSPSVTPSFAEHKEIPSEVPPITPQILAQKDMPAVTPTLKTTGTTTKPTTTTQATTSIRPTERKAKKAKKANKTTKTQKTTVRQKHPPNNVMTVNVKTMKTAKTTKVTKARKPSTTTTATKRSTTTTSKTTTTTPNLITDFAEIYRAEPDPVHLYKTVPPDLLETDSTDFFNTESTPGMTLDDINLVLHNIQNKLQRITSTEYPKFSTGDFKRGTMYSTKHHDIPIQMPKPPNKVEELTIKTKMTRIAKFPLSKRQFKSTSLDGIPVRDGSFYQGINEEQLKNYPYYLSNRNSPHYLSSRYSPHYLSSRYSSAYLNNRNSVPGIKMSSKTKPFYSSTSKPQSGAQRYTDYFNDLVMWHNDILNLDKVPSPVWKDILENVQTDATERYTTPNMSNIIKELKEMNEYLCESDLPTLGESNSSKVMDPYMQMAYTDVQKYPNLNKQGVVRSVVMNDDTIVTSKNLLIKGEAKYYQYNKPSVVVKKIKSSDFMTKLSSPKFNDDEKLSKVVGGPELWDPSFMFYETKEPAILVDTTLMAYDDDAFSVTKGVEVKKLSRDSKKVNKSPFKKHGQLYTPFLKTNKAPMQYFTTPLPMKSDEFNKFLKEHMMDVESVTSPTLELPTFNDNWTTREHKHSTSSLYNIAMKPLRKPPVTKSNPRNIVKIADLKKMNNELMKSINYTSQLLMKTSPPQRPQSNSKANSFEDDFERQKRFSEVSKMPRLASDKSDKVNQEANYYKIIKKKMKERLFEKKGTPAEHPSSGTASFNPRNKEVEITIINFDDIENITTTPAYETYTMPVFKKEETFNMPTYTTELTERTDTTISSTTTEYTPKFEFTAKDEMHNGLLYKDIFNEHDQTTTTSTDFTTLEGKSTTEYVDPSLNEPPSTAMNKIRYPFDKIPQMYPSILDGIPHVKNFNSPPKRVHISSHHYKYDIFYDDNKKIVKSGFDFHTKAPVETIVVGNKRSQQKDNMVILRHPSSTNRDSLFEPAPSMGFGKRSQMKDRYLIPPAIFRKGEAKVDVIKKSYGTAKRNRHARRVSDMEATQKHRMFTWRGCKPKPEGGLSAPGENPEDKITQKEQQTFQPSTPAFTLNADITLQPEFTTQHESTIMSAVTASPPSASPTLSPRPSREASVSALRTSMAVSTEVSPPHGSLVYDLKHLRRTSSVDKNKDKDKDRHRRLFNISALLHDKFKSLMRNLTTAKCANATISTTNHTTKANSKNGPTQTTELRAKKKEKKEIDIEDLNAGGETIFGGPTGTTEKMDPKINKRTTTATITTVKYETNAKKSFLDEIDVEKSTTESEKSHNKGLFNKSNEPLSVEPVVYNDQMYYEEGSHYDPLTPPSPPPSTSETNFFGKHYDIKRDLQTQQNTFTAKDVAALEVIVDLMKNTLSYEEKDIASVFQTNNYIALPHATKSIQPSNESTNAIQVHIAIPFDFQANKKRSPLDPVRVRKVFSAKMSTPVDLEYQVHSFEGTVDSTTEQTVATTTSRNANAAFSPHVSIEGALSPGMYLLVDKPKTGLALKPIKGKINFSDLKTRQVAASTASMSESKPTESREETKSLARVTLSKDFIAAFNKQLIQMYENVSQASLESSNKPRMERSVWKSRKIKAVQSEEVTNEEDDKFFLRRRINWEAVKKYFGHDRVCNCKCRSDKAMCKACAASDAVIDELIFEFDNIGQYMKDHCTEIQTFFWMNPGGGQKLRDSVSRIDKSLADYYKRVKGKCQGRTCKTFTTYIDKRQLVKTSKETRPDSLTHVINELSVLAEDLDKTVSLQACFNQKLKEEGDKFIKAIHNCIMRKSLVKRSNPAGPPKKKLIKNVYSLDNINVNIICNPESSSSSESFEHTSSLVPHQENSHLNDPLLDYVLGTPKHKKRKGLKKLFPRKSKKKLFTYYTSDYTKRPRLHFKRQINYGVVTPLISDGGGAFWNDYIKPSTNEPRVARDSRHDKSIQIAVVQKEANGGPKIQKIIEKPIRHQTPNTIFMTVKTTPQRKFREAETTMDDLTHNINQLLQLFGSLQDIESMNKNSNRSTMFLNHTTASFRDEQTTSTVRNKLDQTTIEKKSTKCIKKVKTKMHYKGDAVPDKPISTTPKSKTLTQTSTLTTDQSERIEIQMEQNEKVLHSKEKEIEQNAKQLAQNEKTSGLKDKQFEQNDKKSAKINKQSEQINKQSEQINKQSEQINTQSEQINKQSEQIDKQTEQINQQSDLREKQFQLFEKQSQQDDKQSEQIDKLSDSKEQQFGQNEKQFDQSGRTELFQELQKQLDQTETSDGVTLDTSYDALDSLESKMASNSKAPTGTPASSKKLTSTTQNPMNASDTIIIRDVTSLRSGKNKTKTTNTVRTITTERTTVKSKVLASVTPKKDEFAETKPQSLIDTETKVTTTTATSFLAKLKTATLKFFDGVSQRSKHPQKTTTPLTTETTTLTTRQTDKLSTTETDPMYLDDSSSVTTRMSPTIVIINEYDNQISSNVLEDPNKDVNSYRNLLLSIIQYETNKLNDEWHRIAYGDRDRDEVGVKRSVAQKVPATTTKASKKPKTTPKSVSTDEDYDVIEGIKDLKNLELPEPTTQARKPAGLLNRIVNKMGMRVVPPDGKQVAKKPSLREIASRKKLNRKRRLKLNSWKMETSTMPVTEKACDSRRTPKASQICDIQATVDHIRLLQKKVPTEDFENLVKNISCYKYKTAEQEFFIPYQRTGKRWDWIRNKRCLRLQVAKFNDDTELDNDQFDIVSFDDDSNDSFEKYVRGDYGIYKIIRRKREAGLLKALDVGLRNIPPLKSTESEVYVMLGDSVTLHCVPYIPIASANKFYWYTDRKRMLNHNNVKVEGIKVTIHNAEPRNTGRYTCRMGQTVQREVQLTVMTIPEYDVVFLPVYKTEEICSYDDLKAIQDLGPLLSKQSNCGKTCSVRIDEPVCQRDRGTNSSLLRSTAVISMNPNHRINCSLQCRRDIASSLVMLSAVNTPYLADIAVVLSKDGVNETLKPWRHFVRPVITHSLRKKDTNGHREYHKLVTTLSPGKVDVVVNCAAGFYLLPESKLCSSCPPDTSSKRGDNTCKSCPRGTRAEPGASQCYAIKTPPRRYDWWWYPPCGYLVACCSIAIGCSVCILLSMIVHILSREMDPVELETSDEERTCTPKTAASITAAYAHTHTRPLSPSRVILPRFFRPSLTSSRATDSQETKFELWKERHIPPPLPPIDFDL